MKQALSTISNSELDHGLGLTAAHLNQGIAIKSLKLLGLRIESVFSTPIGYNLNVRTNDTDQIDDLGKIMWHAPVHIPHSRHKINDSDQLYTVQFSPENLVGSINAMAKKRDESVGLKPQQEESITYQLTEMNKAVTQGMAK